MIQLGEEAQPRISLKDIDLNLTLKDLKKEIKPYQSPAFLVRAKLKAAFDELDEAFWAGAHIEDCLEKRTSLVDRVLRLGWDWYDVNSLPVCLIAVGGYGRCHLHPCSDVDILVFSQDALTKKQTHKIEHFIAYTWDCGMNVGHSVRTLQQCIQLAQQDYTIFSNLIDSRLVTGDSKHFDGLSQFIKTDSKKSIPLEQFFQWKLDERTKRYQRFGDTEYTLEPNLKESPGGLRDIQLLGLFTKREFGTHDLDVLQKIDFIQSQEKKALVKAQNLLWQIRYVLHLCANKREDRLYLDYQEKLSKSFGFFDGNINDAISSMMLLYFRAINELRELTSVLFQHFRELYQRNEVSALPLNAFSQIQNESIRITDETHLKQNPADILILFESLAMHPNLRGFVAKSTRFIRNHYQNHPLIATPETHQFFLNIFNHARGAAKAMRLMARFGLLSQYCPDFAKVVGQMQYDLYHVYTVDAHTLNMLEKVQTFFSQSDYPIELVRKCLAEKCQPLTLYLSALFHDIAKGQGGNHSQKGELIAEKFCKDHQLDLETTSRIKWLVKEHLTFSNTARTKDLSDPQVIADFCNTIKTIDNLNHLYVMTVADILATNPTLWNKWQESLLKNLYLAARELLSSQAPVETLTRIKAIKTQAKSILIKDGIKKEEIDKLWQNFGNEYFQSENIETIIWHSKELIKNVNQKYPIIALAPHSSQVGTEIFIFAPDRVHLFSMCAATLDKLQLSVVQARILTSKNNYCMNNFVVLESTGLPIVNPHRKLEIQHTLTALLTPLMKEDNLPPRIPFVSHRIRRQLIFFKHQASVTISNNEKANLTVLVVHAPDFPGLLARVGEAFITCDIFVHGAKINTLGKRVEDIFYITERKTKRAISSSEAQLNLKSVILDKLSAYWA